MTRLLSPWIAAVAICPFALTGLATAQNDECATAISVTAGAFAFDTTAATLSAPPWPCAGNGGPDLWYSLTATANSTITATTCGGATFDTALQAFSGTCGVLVSVVCNDDACGLQSRIQFPATSGQTYYIRVGGFNGSTGTGTLSIGDGSPVLNPANGTYYRAVAAPGITWTQARSDAAASTFQGRPGRLATLNDQVENDFVFSALGGVNNHWIGGFQNTASPSYSEPGGGWEWITGEPFSFTQWLPGEPNNTGAFGAEDYLELLQSTAFGQTWNDAAELEHPAGYVIEYSGSGIGVNYCSPVANTTGVPANMSATGSASVVSNNLVIEARAMPLNIFGFFLTSQTQGFVTNPGGSQGHLCLSGVIGRYVRPGQIQNTGATGGLSLALNLNLTPAGSVFVSILAGETRNFQAWFRDIGPGGIPWSNFTDGLAVTFN